MKRTHLPTILTALALPLFALSASAAEEPYRLETITVTAEKRSEDIQNVAASVTAIPEQQIRDAGIRDIQDFSGQVPNMYIANWGIRGISFVYARGIGAGSMNTDNPALGFYVDDVGYLDSRVFNSPLFDIERIEVLRGPQGTLYGRDTLGGVINIVTKKPDNELRYGLEQSVGSEKFFETTAWLRAPLIEDRLFFGFSGAGEHFGGFADNDWLGEEVDTRRGFNGRMQLRWLPSDRLDALLSVDGEKLDDGGYPLAFMRAAPMYLPMFLPGFTMPTAENNPHHVAYDFEAGNEREALGASLRVAWDGPAFKLTSITAGRGYDDDTHNDQDFMPLDFITASETIENRQFTQEFRVASPEDSGPLKWLGGYYFFRADHEHHMDINYLSNYFGAMAAMGGMDLPFAMPDTTATTDTDRESYGHALFGQATWTLFDRLDLTGGLRYEYTKDSLDYASGCAHSGLGACAGGGMEQVVGMLGVNPMPLAATSSSHGDELLPKAQIAYHWTPDLMTYASVARGYRSGGFNTSFTDMADLAYAPEYSWNYEAGFKSSWFDRRLSFNTSFFYITLSDQQVTQVLPTANAVIRNAGKSRSLGFESELSARLAEGLSAQAGFGLTDAEFRRYETLDQFTLTPLDLSGHTPPLAPEYTWNLALQYRRPLIDAFRFLGRGDSLTWTTRAEVRGVGKFYWNSENTLAQSPYELVNLRTGLETDNFSLILWADNLFDRRYNAVAFAFQEGAPLAQVADGRSFGATLRFEF